MTYFTSEEVLACVQDLLPNLMVMRLGNRIDILGSTAEIYVYGWDIVAFKDNIVPGTNLESLFDLQDWIVDYFYP